MMLKRAKLIVVGKRDNRALQTAQLRFERIKVILSLGPHFLAILVHSDLITLYCHQLRNQGWSIDPDKSPGRFIVDILYLTPNKQHSAANKFPARFSGFELKQ